MVELCFFMLIYLLFFFAFGISTYSMMFSNRPLDAELLRQVFFPSFWVLAGQYYTRDILMFCKSIHTFNLYKITCPLM